MRPAFMELRTAKRGIQVNQKVINTVGNNISNSKTKGYIRQRLDTVSTHTYGDSQYSCSSIPLARQSMDARGVTQIHNPYLDAKFRQQYGDVGYYGQKAAIMDQIEGVISNPEVGGAGTKAALTILSQALADFDQSPYQETNASIVMDAFKGATQVLNEHGTNLKTLVEQTKDDLSVTVEDINTKLDQLSELNSSITHEIFSNNDYDGVNYGPNNLLDQRDVILDDLSRYDDAQVTNLKDGKIQVKISGKVVVDASGASYINGKFNIGSNGVTLTWNSNNQSANLGAGAIRGFADMLTGTGPINAGIPYYQNKIDNFAQTLADVLNSKIRTDDPDFPNKYKFPLQGGVDDKVTAGNISASNQWADDVSYIIRKQNPDGELDNQDILDMKAAFGQNFNFGGGYTDTFSGFITSVTDTLGSRVKANSARMSASLIIAESADSERMSVSDVSLNEERIGMMTYSKACQALGRPMTTMDEQLDVIVNKMGVVRC